MPDRVSAISNDRLGKAASISVRRTGNVMQSRSILHLIVLSAMSSNTMSNPLILKCEIQISKLKDKKD